MFAFLSLGFFILLILLRVEFPLLNLMSYRDAFDVLTPLVLIPIYWLLFKYAASGAPSLAEEIAFAALAAIWVEGQGLHLAANSISLSEPLKGIRYIRVETTDSRSWASWREIEVITGE